LHKAGITFTRSQISESVNNSMKQLDLDQPDSQILNAVLFFLTNETRVKNGQKELTYHPRLEESAEIHSKSMVSDEFFDHINHKSKKLREPNEPCRFVGISNPMLAENIIEGFLLQYREMSLYIMEVRVFSGTTRKMNPLNRIPT